MKYKLSGLNIFLNLSTVYLLSITACYAQNVATTEPPSAQAPIAETSAPKTMPALEPPPTADTSANTANTVAPIEKETDLAAKLLLENTEQAKAPQNVVVEAPEAPKPKQTKMTVGKWAGLIMIAVCAILSIGWLFSFLKKRKRRKAFGDDETCITIDPEDGRRKKRKKNKFADPFAERK